MKVVWTTSALDDLDQALAHAAEHYPSVVAPLESRVRSAVRRIARWPKSARAVDGHPDVRVVPLVRYPYRIFYRVTDAQIEVLHMHHTARDDPDT